MARAVPMSAIGTGYLVSHSSARIFVRETLGRYHVCVRDRGEEFAEIVAETKTSEMAEAVADHLRRSCSQLDVSDAYQEAYDRAVREHPKGGGLLGATARLLCAQAAGDKAVRKLRRKGKR